jgi:hypothetical protein
LGIIQGRNSILAKLNTRKLVYPGGIESIQNLIDLLESGDDEDLA